MKFLLNGGIILNYDKINVNQTDKKINIANISYQSNTLKNSA